MFAKLFKNRGARFYIELCAGFLTIVAALIFFALDRQILVDIKFSDSSEWTLVYLLIGGLVLILDAFFPLPFLGVAGTILLGLGIGSHLRIACYPMADLGQNVPFFTGSTEKATAAVTLFVTFLIIFLLFGIASIVCNFLSPKKAER